VEQQFFYAFWTFRFDSEHSAVCSMDVISTMSRQLSPSQPGHGQQLRPRVCPGASPIFAGQMGRVWPWKRRL